MPVELAVALNLVEDAAARIFDADPQVRSVGVGAGLDGHGFVAVRNARAISALAFRIGAPPVPADVHGIPVAYVNSYADPSQLARVPHSGPASPGIGSLILEQQGHAPLACGLQIQNFDDDVRTGTLTQGLMTIGTLGCFVRTQSGAVAILSNNHVIAGENRGIAGTDRILHPGSAAFVANQHGATLTAAVALRPSPAGASLANGTVILNDVDAGIAELLSGAGFSQAYLPGRSPLTADRYRRRCHRRQGAQGGKDDGADVRHCQAGGSDCGAGAL